MIPLFRPCLDGALRSVETVFEDGWLGLGSVTAEFERAVAGVLETQRHVVATNTGTSALHLACVAAGVGPGDEVITPSFNYVADHQAIHMTGATAVMCDVRLDDFGIDAAKAEALITDRTKAVMPLHFAGMPCDQAGVYELARRYGLRVIEDCTHAFGTTVAGRKLGSYGDLAVYSFDPVKIVTTVDGGCIVTASEEEDRLLRRLRYVGIDREGTKRSRDGRFWNYDVVSPGFRYHLSNVNASIGLSQIALLDAFIASRRETCRAYSGAFSQRAGLAVPPTGFAGVSPFIYPLRVLDGRRDAMIAHLRELEIEAGIHFIPAHAFEYFSHNVRGDMTVTDRVAGEVLTLPLHSNMRPDFVARVIEGVLSFLG
ncbi:MAG TPA: DegT/DnrJ/EryC1/StrS family aminotransferase [Candidatus Acidoferrales bacterium]|nr:DegT/DnrJ/EryC1/StrS family aminotransferase [Candidatus Acidoferrales bacterium]